MEETEKIQRCAIYAFYDKDGYVDEYVFCMLNAICQVAERIIFVANGKLLKTSQKRLCDKGVEIIKRENDGFDIWAYKTGLNFIGWKMLSTYDEVILLNDTILGPVFSITDLFQNMNHRNCDFWGLVRHPESHLEIFRGSTEYGFLPEHIQSFFMVFRHEMIISYEFQLYWDNLLPMKSYLDAVYKHEAVFTKYFEDKGFIWDVYMHTEDLDATTLNPMIYYPKVLIEKYNCPFFKRRVFFNDYRGYLQNTLGQSAMELYDYLREKKLYDVNLLWDNLLRTCNMQDLFKTLHLNYILSSNMSHREKMRNVLRNKRTALIIHIYFIDLLDDTYKYVSQIPDLCDIYITTNSEVTKRAVEEKFGDIKSNYMEIRVIKNRGRDVASILVGVKDIVDKYEYLCFAHDKKSTQVLGSVGESFSYKCFENTLCSEDFIYNIIETFEDNPRLGILCPPEPNHADYSPTIGNAWGKNENYRLTLALADEMGITVSIARDRDAVAPYGSFFWFRYDALKAFYDKGWEYEDFPEEPLPPDGTISHAIERIRPYVAQQAGYYTAYVMNDRYARIEYTNLHTYTEEFNKACFDNGFVALHYPLVEKISEKIAEKKN